MKFYNYSILLLLTLLTSFTPRLSKASPPPTKEAITTFSESKKILDLNVVFDSKENMNKKRQRKLFKKFGNKFGKNYILDNLNRLLKSSDYQSMILNTGEEIEPSNNAATLSIISIVLALLSPILVLAGLQLIAFVFAPLAIITGIMAIKEIKKNPGSEKYRLMAQVGLIGGVIATAIYTSVFFWLINSCC